MLLSNNGDGDTRANQWSVLREGSNHIAKTPSWRSHSVLARFRVSESGVSDVDLMNETSGGVRWMDREIVGDPEARPVGLATPAGGGEQMFAYA